MGHSTTRKATFVTTLAAAAIALLMSTSASVAIEATEIRPGPERPGTPPALSGKGEGPWSKAGSTLRRVFAAHAARQQARGSAPFKPDNPSVQYARGLILIDAVAASDGAALLEDLRGLGLQNGTQYGAVVSGRIPLGLLGRVVELEGLRGVSASLKPETNSAVDPTFGLVHDRRAAIAMSLIASEAGLQNYTGDGIKVGVLSDTFDNNGNPDYDGNGIGEPPATNADDDFANGDLPGGTASFVVLHTPGDVDDDDKSAFGANGTSGANATAGDATQSANLGASIRFSPGDFLEPLAAVVSYPKAEQYDIGISPFTIEMWVRYNSFDPSGRWSALASKHSPATNQLGFMFWNSGPNDPVPNSLTLTVFPGNTTDNKVRMTRPWIPNFNQWYHVAIARDDAMNTRMFVDGNQLGANEHLPLEIFDADTPLRISGFDNAGLPRPLDGWVEDFRFVVGEALYTSNFTPPNVPLASELPGPGPTATTTVIDDSGNPGIDEGRAMMQLIHDVAPDASVSFHTAFNGLADFAQGIQDLANDGADVIVDDIIYFAEPMFQDGIVAQSVDNVVSQGKAYFSSAGNSAQNSYESPFVASGERLTVNGFFGPEERGMLHDFDPSQNGVDYKQSVTIPVGTTFTLVTQWDQPFASNCAGCPGSANDVDIYLVDDADNIITSSISDNLSSGEPVEVLQLQNTGAFGTSFHIMMTHYDVVTTQHPRPGSPPTLMKYVWFGQSAITVNEFTTDSPASYGHANSVGAEAVGAAFYLNTPAFGVSPPLLESFSSQGGVPILFDVSGNELGVPDVREKPEIVAPDGTNTTFFYRDTSADDADEAPETFPNFFGTSAAAPHAAAIAALMLEANPSLLPADIYAALENTAVDMGAARFDNDTGYGLVDATSALAEITGSNLVPLASNDTATTNQNTPVSIPVLANDALGNQPTAITQVTNPPNGTAVINGTSVDYTPDTDYFGSDSFGYTIADNDGETSVATVNVTVNEVDILPNAVGDNAVTVEDVTANNIDVLVNDNLGNAPTTITSAGPVSTKNGTVTTDGSTVTYTPPADYFGPDTFPYTIEDANGDQSTATVSMSVNPVNDPPVFSSDPIVRPNAVAGAAYTGQTLTGIATDPEADTLTYSKTAGPTWLNVAANGDLSGTPTDLDASLQNLFTVQVADSGSPTGTNSATLSIFVEPAPVGNSAPVANNDNYNTSENVALNIAAPGVLNGDTDGDGDPLTAVLNTSTSNGALLLNGNGSFDYTPNANFNGQDSFTYHANDGTADSNIATVAIMVNAINDTPTANAGPDQTVTDSGGDGIETVTLDGSASSDVDGTIAAYNWNEGATVLGSDAALPVSLPVGVHTLTLTVIDNDGASASDTVVITIEALGASVLLLDDFDDGNFDGWSVFDEGTRNAPSAWSAASGVMRQSSNIYSLPTSASSLPKLGTYARFDGGTGWTDYRVTLTLNSTDDDDIGLMFRVQNSNNYYRFSWDKQRNYRRLVKNVSGAFTLLDWDSVPYVSGQTYQLEVTVQGTFIEVRIDGVPVLSAVDGDLPVGTIALYSWGTKDALFDDILVEDLVESGSQAPIVTSVAATMATVDVAYSYDGDDTIDVAGTEPITFSLVDGPAGMSVDSSGLVSWTSTSGQEGTHPVEIMAENAFGFDTQNFTIEVFGASVLLLDDFDDGNFDGWSVFDEGTRNAPSAWSAASGVMRQSSNIHSRPTDASSLPKLGTYAQFDGGTGWTDYRVTLTLNSTDDDDIGLMFRVQNSNNYYRFSWDKQRNYRRLVKNTDGVFTLLDGDTVPYVRGQTYQLEVTVQGTFIEVRIDGVVVLSAVDGDLPAGTIALYSWGTKDALFDDILVEGL